jgi:hypothetical protein
MCTKKKKKITVVSKSGPISVYYKIHFPLGTELSCLAAPVNLLSSKILLRTTTELPVLSYIYDHLYADLDQLPLLGSHFLLNTYMQNHKNIFKNISATPL